MYAVQACSLPYYQRLMDSTNSFQFILLSILYFSCINAERELMEKRMPKDSNEDFTIRGGVGNGRSANRVCTLLIQSFKY